MIRHLVGVVLFIVIASPALADPYAAVLGGIAQPELLTQAQVFNVGTPTPISSLRSGLGAAVEGKVGYGFASWFAVEAIALYANPPTVQQMVTLPNGGSGLESGHQSKYLTMSLDAVFRYPGKTVMPYVGAGPALFVIANQGGWTSHYSVVGFDLMIGLRYVLMQHIGIVLEGHRQQNKLSFVGQPMPSGPDAGYSAKFADNVALIGASYAW